MLRSVAERFSCLPGEGRIVEFPHPNEPLIPSAYRACYQHRCREDAPIQVLLNGHIDTVFAADHAFQQCEILDAQGIIKGPGVADMKGGIVIMLAALELFESLQYQGDKNAVGWEVLITCDEEIGSPHSRPVLESAALRNHLGITFESSLPDGKLVRRRMGVGYAHAKVLGRSAHVGRNFAEGKNAIVKLCDWITRIHALNDNIPGAIVNTGSIQGGGPLNVVSEQAEARFNLRVDSASAEARLFDAMGHIHRAVEETGYECRWSAHINRKAKETGPAFEILFSAWQHAAAQLGQTLDWRDTGGGSDGNILQAAGLPIIDNLGIIGDQIHSPDEWALLSSIPERTALVTMFLHMLSDGEFDRVSHPAFAHHLKSLQEQQNSFHYPSAHS